MQVMDEIVLRTAKAMVSEGIPFRGVLFAGLMIKNGKVSVSCSKQVQLGACKQPQKMLLCRQSQLC